VPTVTGTTQIIETTTTVFGWLFLTPSPFAGNAVWRKPGRRGFEDGADNVLAELVDTASRIKKMPAAWVILPRSRRFFPLDARHTCAYNPFQHPGVVSGLRPDSEGEAWWKSPQGSGAEVARNTAEEIVTRVERHGWSRYRLAGWWSGWSAPIWVN
jgi:hypothetical protein